MKSGSHDLHGSAPDKCSVALLLIDVINAFDFEGSEQLLDRALKIAPSLAGLIGRARENQVPVVYVNDNFGRWRSDFRAQIDHCLEGAVPGAPFVTQLKPTPQDYFVLKPEHSGFYSTVLELLLEHLAARTLIIAGIATDICVLFTANDAYMRDYQIIIPRDGVAAATQAQDEYALHEMRQILKATIQNSADIDLSRLKFAHSHGDS